MWQTSIQSTKGSTVLAIQDTGWTGFLSGSVSQKNHHQCEQFIPVMSCVRAEIGEGREERNQAVYERSGYKFSSADKN